MKGIFRCEPCEIELELFKPVDRPCPGCGGPFTEIDEYDIDTGMPKRLTSMAVERTVAREFPAMMHGIEEYLKNEA